MEHPCIPGGCSRNIQHTAGSPCAWQGESLIVSGLTALSSALDTNTSLQLLGTAQAQPRHRAGQSQLCQQGSAHPSRAWQPWMLPTINRMLLTDPVPPFSTVLSPRRGWETPEALPHSPTSHKPALKSSLGQAPSCGTHTPICSACSLGVRAATLSARCPAIPFPLLEFLTSRTCWATS